VLQLEGITCNVYVRGETEGQFPTVEIIVPKVVGVPNMTHPLEGIKLGLVFTGIPP
jgi:hypothetical protein